MLISLALLLLIAVLVACVIDTSRRRSERLGILPLAVLSFTFQFVVQPMTALWNDQLEVLLTAQQIAQALFVPAVMLACILWGWRDGGRRHTQVKAVTTPPAWPVQRLWVWGAITSLAGMLLWIVFLERSGGVVTAYGASHGGAMAWQENTAYLYLGPHWVIVGMAMMILASSRARRRAWQVVILSLVIGLLYCNAVLMASRTMFFTTTVAIGAAHALARRRTVTLTRAWSVLIIAAIGALLMLGYREVLYLGTTYEGRPDLLSALHKASETEESSTTTGVVGNEFIFHAATLATVNETAKLDLGVNWVFTFTWQLIPRILWHDKPYAFETPGITMGDIQTVTGLTIASGAGTGIVADIYRQFWWFGCLFFFLFGRITRRWYERARRLESPGAVVSYVAFYSLGLNCFSQGFSSILVPLAYSLAPIMMFEILNRVATPRRHHEISAAQYPYRSVPHLQN